MNAGRLSDQIVVEERVITVVSGQKVISWTDAEFSPLWAEVLRTTETLATFTIRYRSGMDASTHRIAWENLRWIITSVTHDRRRTATTISCDLTNTVETTTLESTEREFIEAVPIVEPPDA